MKNAIRTNDVYNNYFMNTGVYLDIPFGLNYYYYYTENVILKNDILLYKYKHTHTHTHTPLSLILLKKIVLYFHCPRQAYIICNMSNIIL